MTTEPTTINDISFELRSDDDQIVVDDVAGHRTTTSAHASDAIRNRRRVRQFAAVAGAVAGLAIAAGASTLLVERTTSAPDRAPIPAAVSPSDVALGYLFSADFPADIDMSAGTVRQSRLGLPSPADEALGYLLSAEFPTLPSDLDR